MAKQQEEIIQVNEKLENMVNIPLEVEENKETAVHDWVNEVNKNLQNMVKHSAEMDDSWTKRSIYKVPVRVSDLNEKAYKPQVVSLGPYHCGETHLMAMEEHKQKALVQFLNRSNISLLSLVQCLADELMHLKESYDMLDRKWEEDTGKFLQVMILDGCFMLEIFHFSTLTLDDDEATALDSYTLNDPIFSRHGKLYMMPHIKHDMLLLENQVPMLVLDKLFSFQFQGSSPEDEEEYVNNLILKFFFPNITISSRHGNCLHLLDLYRKNMVQKDGRKRKPQRLQQIFRKGSEELHRSASIFMQVIHRQQKGLYKGGEDIIQSARELNEAGVEFKKSKSTSLASISFQGGFLELPFIIVDDTTESIFLNMVAFERLHFFAGNEVTSYIFFMDSIINNEKDVALLHCKGIIKSSMGSNKAVAKLFNSLSKDIPFDPAESNLHTVHKNVHDYCQKSWNQWRANLIRTYFRNPWAFLSLTAAIILFVLTIAQTVFTIRPPSSGSGSGSEPKITPRGRH